MSIIENAAKRLEQLRQAGAEIPEDEVARDRFSQHSVQTCSAEQLDSRQKSSAPSTGTSPSLGKATNSAPSSTTTKRLFLDFEAMAAAGLLVPSQSRNLLANEFRVIKRPLIANAMGKGPTPVPNGNLIMVTSALQGEGKSFTAVNLAISIAMELDNTVLLVDADVARPSVLTMLGQPASAGFLDVVKENSLDISQVLLRTNIENLSILPSGNPHQRATELLASDAMTSLLDDMAKRYPDRIIVFDSPPLLLTTEARALATHMGQIVVVVRFGETTQAAVNEAISTIEACPLKMLVLSQAPPSATKSYGYGYGYGYGYDNEK